ncbi:hypothetical protein CCACVL1_24537 [Corchorus capsularis]|uniref:Uncharacterized protein n=1 Tax=Corchorus capsularis TaxID=210143 RepID=A0A1R3GPE7_COCAP|nr:hypothetical protein CCACVL1_24537 [Corchorus capsularis]
MELELDKVWEEWLVFVTCEELPMLETCTAGDDGVE